MSEEEDSVFGEAEAEEEECERHPALDLPPCFAAPEGVAEEMEEAMACWLSHPAEYGERPEKARWRCSLKTVIWPGDEPEDVHLVDYWYPGRGKATGFAYPLAWSFMGLSDWGAWSAIDLAIAYGGWHALFASGAETVEPSERTKNEALLLARQAGVESAHLKKALRVGGFELAVFSGLREGKPVVGAAMPGICDAAMALDADGHLAQLPPEFRFLGLVMRNEI